jgi:hypothetical protein
MPWADLEVRSLTFSCYYLGAAIRSSYQEQLSGAAMREQLLWTKTFSEIKSDDMGSYLGSRL